ncbi:MAG: hypothetical protein ACT6RP_00885 [Roseateles sp.]|uniref:hypothetical protein n=1 Tax=Roseateles sp. TaxID=1971397 RepID=UPI004037513C
MRSWLLWLALLSSVAGAHNPRQPARLAKALNGTQCDASQCVAAVAWAAERVARIGQCLGSLD